MNVLVVDDLEEARHLLKKILEKNGFSVTTAANGKEALEAVRRSPPDLIVSDILMPEMDGYQFCQKVRQQEGLDHIPFVFYTATYTDQRDKELAMQMGADGFIVKPEPIASLVAKIRRIAEKGKKGRIDRSSGGSSSEDEMFTLYDERLVKKLEKKMLQLEQENQLRRQSEVELKDTMTFFQTLIDTLPSPVFYKDAEGRYLGGNRAWSEQIVGLPLADVVGKTVFELPWNFQPELAEKIHEVDLSLMQTGGTEDHETRMQFSDGRRRDFMVKKAVYYDAEGRKAGIVGLMFDLTEKNLAEAERRKLEEQLRQAVKMEAVGTLAGGIAHDFNNLLTTILGCVHLIEAEKSPVEQPDEDLAEIEKAAQRAAKLTQQLLAFSRKQPARLQVFDPNQRIADLEKMLRRTIGENIRLTLDLAPDLSPIRADPGQIEQVLVNLAVNARDAMPDGGRLSLETGNVRLEPSFFTQRRIEEASGNYVRIKVSDTGAGMTAEVIEQIFDPFFTTKKRGRGTGLGLSTVYGIVKQNSGFVLAESEPEQGTTITVYLPECPEGVSAGETSGPATGAVSGKGVSVLVVEDDPSVRRVVRHCLKGGGFDVIEAESGEHALSLEADVLDSVDLVLTDVILTGIDGIELARRLETRRPGIRILFMSGYAEDRQAVRKLVASDRFVEKPIDPEELVRRIAAVLNGPDPG
ncbi:MAG: response regulator [Desulfobacterales bacterium]|nr:response regulator [Desulfobacterales bacterium]